MVVLRLRTRRKASVSYQPSPPGTGVPVVVVPGKAFGSDEFVRLSYACSNEQIDKGLERIARFVKGL